MFVFVVIFSFFGVPSLYQHRVLFYGILGALIFRAIFIALGVGAAVVSLGDRPVRRVVDLHRLQDARARLRARWIRSTNPLVRLTRRLMPVADRFDGKNFFSRIDGRGMRRRCSWR